MSEISEPKHPDFVKIYKQFIKRYGAEDGPRYYYMWLNHLGLDDTKSYGSQANFEQFRWAARTIDYHKELPDAKLYKCEAIFPLTSMNNNVYTEDELLRGTRTLIGKPVNMNHDGHPLEGVDIIGAEYEDGCAECLIKIGNDAECRRGHNVQNMIKEGEIWNVSIEATCTLGFQGNGCGGLVFTGLGLLTKDTLPGVPMARIYSAESLVIEKIVESFDPTDEEINSDFVMSQDNEEKFMEISESEKTISGKENEKKEKELKPMSQSGEDLSRIQENIGLKLDLGKAEEKIRHLEVENAGLRSERNAAVKQAKEALDQSNEKEKDNAVLIAKIEQYEKSESKNIERIAELAAREEKKRSALELTKIDLNEYMERLSKCNKKLESTEDELGTAIKHNQDLNNNLEDYKKTKDELKTTVKALENAQRIIDRGLNISLR